jgi:nucleoside-triphosphatase
MPQESPCSLKKNFYAEVAMIVLITGESGCGKTTLCAHVVAALKARGLDVAGVLTLPRFSDGKKIGMDVEDVRTGERGALADHCVFGAGTANLAWKFDDAGLARGAQILREATPCDVLVIDELGPLELLRNTGWIHALDLLRACHYRLALVVVRPSLLVSLQMRLEGFRTMTLNVTGVNHDELSAQIVAQLGERR